MPTVCPVHSTIFARVIQVLSPPVLYRPEVAHEELPEDPEAHDIYRIRIGAVVVRYVEDWFSVQVTVEGELPADGVEQIRNDLIEKLEALEQSLVEYRAIPPA